MKTSDKKRISVIVGTYNQVEHLPRLIESLSLQTFKDFDVHICDDGSDDWTREYINSLKTDFPLYYHRQKNKGMRLAKNLNNGARNATGDFCLFIMGDSFPETNYLEVMNEYAMEDTIVCGARVQVDGKRIVEIEWRIRKGIVPEAPVLLVNEPSNKITGNGLMIPTDAMRRHGFWNEKLSGYGGDDNEIVARLYYKGYLVMSVPQAILYHNYHNEQTNDSANNEKLNALIHKYKYAKK